MSGRHGSLLEAIDASRYEMIDFTRELVAIPTENPPGAEYERCAGVIAQKLKEIGLEPRVVEVPAPKPEGYRDTASPRATEKVNACSTFTDTTT
jgi:acetylornithine deacetylase/succinyl-diaminopimelate desuccinylase-like protein